jgi:hypothetical protein
MITGATIGLSGFVSVLHRLAVIVDANIRHCEPVSGRLKSLSSGRISR